MLSAMPALQAVLAAPAEARAGAVEALAAAVKAAGNMKAAGIYEALKAALDDGDAGKREAAVASFGALAALGLKPLEPALVSLLGLVLERMADKIVTVRAVAEGAVKALSDTISPDATKTLLPTLFAGMASAKQWCVPARCSHQPSAPSAVATASATAGTLGYPG